MKKQIFLIGFSILVRNILLAQTDILKGLDILNDDGCDHFTLLPNNEIIATGKANYSMSEDFYMIKSDSNLNLQWLHHFKDTANSISDFIPTKILASEDSGYMLTGVFFHPVYNGGLLKFDNAGFLQWYKRYLMPNINYSRTSLISIIKTNDSNYVLLGQGKVICTTIEKSHVFISKVDKYGNIIWNKYYRQPNLCYDEFPYDIIQTYDSGFLITGQNLNYGNDAFVMKTDSTGNLQWYKIYQAGYLYYNKILQQSDHSFLLLGYCFVGSSGCCMTRIDSLGNIIWNKKYDNTSGLYDADMKTDSSLILSSSLPGANHVTLKTDINGNVISAFSDSLFFYRKIRYMNDSSLLMAGLLYNPGTGTNDGFLLKSVYPPSSCTPTPSVAVTEIPFTSTVLNITGYNITSPVYDSIIPLYAILDSVGFTYYDVCSTTSLNDKYEAENNFSFFPNPATDYITIHSNTLWDKNISISLFDIYGRQLKDFTENSNFGKVENGEIKISLKEFVSGIYFIRLGSGGKETVKNVVKY